MITKATVCYYAECKHTGEIWESRTFKPVYDAVKRSLKYEMHHATYYDNELVTIHYGLYIREDGNFFRYESLREVATVFCSGIDGAVHYEVDHSERS